MQMKRMYDQTEMTSQTVLKSEAEWPCSHRRVAAGPQVALRFHCIKWYLETMRKSL